MAGRSGCLARAAGTARTRTGRDRSVYRQGVARHEAGEIELSFQFGCRGRPGDKLKDCNPGQRAGDNQDDLNVRPDNVVLLRLAVRSMSPSSTRRASEGISGDVPYPDYRQAPNFVRRNMTLPRFDGPYGPWQQALAATPQEGAPIKSIRDARRENRVARARGAP